MGAVLSNAWTQIREFFAKLERKNKIRLGIAAAVIVVGAIVTAVLLGRVTYGVLYAGLAPAESGAILNALTERGVPYRAEGNAILIPENQISEMRMTLSSEGYNDASALDFSIMQNASGFGSTDIERQAYLTFQYQDNIRRALLRLDKIDDAVVLISLPRESSFVLSGDVKEATASVTLDIKNGATLTPAEAVAVGETVAAALPGLLPSNVKIIDTAANLYSAIPIEITGEEHVDDAVVVANQILLQSQVKQQIETQVVNLLTPVYGEGKVKAAVAVTLNFDKESSQIIEFAPPVDGETEGLVLSMEELYERIRETDEYGEVPGTDSNGMGSFEDIDGTDEYPYIENYDNGAYSRLLRKINYELNNTTTDLEKARGTVSRLSIGVLIDSSVIKDDYTKEVQNLVANAIGVAETNVSVARLPVTNVDNSVAAGLEYQRGTLTRLELINILKIAVICITALAFLIFALILLRNLYRSAHPQTVAVAGGPDVSGDMDLAADLEMYGAFDGMDGVSYISSAPAESAYAYTGVTASDLEDLSEPEEEVGVTIGGERPDALVNLEKMISQDPKAIASILKNWLNED
ncbi:MAG: flagellar M-ring protein FliF [Oscillospiraceae bacterium]|jgi:flagellar M-ring protein FliF|nr:flagellar M-ring protein FliF [Oscillospiraceae bacterium]